jgi:hypothetical protein
LLILISKFQQAWPPSTMQYFRFARSLALAFFIAGTFILTWFYLIPSPAVALFAYQFTIVAIIANWFYAAIVLFSFLRVKVSMQHTLRSLGVMMLNIPVGILYAYVMVWLLGYARVTLQNNSGATLGSISIEGCTHKVVKDLGAGEAHTVWIKITSPCDVSVTYEVNDMRHKEVVVSGLTEGNGGKVTYSIGGTEEKNRQ